MKKVSNSQYTGSNGRQSLIDLEIPNHFNGQFILFVHGFMGFKDWGAWHLVQEFFVERGFGFCKFNLSHNGGSIENGIDFPDEEAFGRNCYSFEVADIQHALNFLCKEVPQLKCIRLIGHSRGGGDVILAGHQIGDSYPISSVHTWAAISDIGMRFPSDAAFDQWKKEGVRYVQNGRTKQDLPQYFSLYEDFIRHESALNIRHAIENLQIPIFIYHGEQDTSVPLEEGLSLAKWGNVPLHQIIGADHVFGATHPWTSPKLPLELAELCERTFQHMK